MGFCTVTTVRFDECESWKHRAGCAVLTDHYNRKCINQPFPQREGQSAKNKELKFFQTNDGFELKVGQWLLVVDARKLKLNAADY